MFANKPFSDNADVALMTKLLTLNLLKKVHVRHRLIQIDLQEFHHCHLYTVETFRSSEPAYSLFSSFVDNT